MSSNVYVGSLFSSKELYHHGILGMKWGVRRYQDKNGSLTSAGKKRYSKTGNKIKSTGKKLVKSKFPQTMTDKELETAIKRLEKEARYLDLKRKARPGRAYATQILADVGKKVIVTAGAGATLYMLKHAVSKEKELNYGALADAMFRGGAEKKKK